MPYKPCSCSAFISLPFSEFLRYTEVAALCALYSLQMIYKKIHTAEGNPVRTQESLLLGLFETGITVSEDGIQSFVAGLLVQRTMLSDE